jgi:hypothetical protein
MTGAGNMLSPTEQLDAELASVDPDLLMSEALELAQSKSSEPPTKDS